MIRKADLGRRPIFLSVAVNDGTMEAFDDLEDAVAQATDLVNEDNDDEHLIYVAMPRARVRMAVRVDPIELSLSQAPETLRMAASAKGERERAQGLDSQPNGHDHNRHDSSVPWAHES